MLGKSCRVPPIGIVISLLFRLFALLLGTAGKTVDTLPNAKLDRTNEGRNGLPSFPSVA